jgi:23S rRNA (guanine745-N1)-methyltransferase
LTPVSATNGYECTNAHRFDQAKEGYLNLLLAQHKRSRNPGDDPAMMASRQAFLNSGHYHFLANALAEKVADESPASLLDIGCGEGYYGAQLHLHPKITHCSLAGLDIAKGGVRLAARRKVYQQLAVASAFDLPFVNQSFDSALCVFSPLDANEAARVLKPNGFLITVGPAAGHLRGLAEQIYQQFLPHQEASGPIAKSPHFRCVDDFTLTKDITVEGEDIFNLLTMTPYYWSASEEKQQALKQLAVLTTPLAFRLRVYRRYPADLSLRPPASKTPTTF